MSKLTFWKTIQWCAPAYALGAGVAFCVSVIATLGAGDLMGLLIAMAKGFQAFVIWYAASDISDWRIRTLENEAIAREIVKSGMKLG